LYFLTYLFSDTLRKIIAKHRHWFINRGWSERIYIRYREQVVSYHWRIFTVNLTRTVKKFCKAKFVGCSGFLAGVWSAKFRKLTGNPSANQFLGDDFKQQSFKCFVVFHNMQRRNYFHHKSERFTVNSVAIDFSAVLIRYPNILIWKLTFFPICLWCKFWLINISIFRTVATPRIRKFTTNWGNWDRQFSFKIYVRYNMYISLILHLKHIHVHC